ncbi:MAG: PAS domain-containing protein, partial [Rubrivivax sp.]
RPAQSALLPVALMLLAVGVIGLLRAQRHMRQTARQSVEAARRADEAQRLADAAEAARREAAERNRLLNLLLATTTEGFWFIDPEGVTLDLNPAMARLLGRPREAIVGRQVREFFEGDSLATLQAQLARRSAGMTGTYEVEIRRPDGSVVHCVNAATPLRDAEGRPAGSVGIWTDITERRRAEEVLLTYERVANSIADPVSVIGEDLVYRMVNDAWCRLSGIPREQAVGRRSDEVLPRAYNDERRRAYAECLERREPRRAVSPLCTPGQSERVYETTYYPYDGTEGVRKVVIVSRDITDLEMSRRELAESAEYLRRTLNTTGDGIFASDAEDLAQPVRFVNEQMLRIWGIPADEAPGLTPARIMAAATPLFADPERESRRVAEIVAGNLADECHLALRDGRVLLRRCSPARLGDRTIRVWSFRDVTAETRALESAREREAEQRALLDAIPGFIARVDAQGTYTYVNRRMAALCRLAPEQLVGQRVDAGAGGERLAPLLALVPRALAGETVTVEYRHRPDRETPPTDVQITVAPGVHPGTGAPAVYGFGIDISDLKRTQESLRAQQAELRAVLAAFPGYIASVDEQMRYLFVNHALAHRMGRPAAEVLGHTVEEMMGPELAATIGAELRLAIGGGRSQVDRHYPAARGLPALDLEVTHVAGPLREDGRRQYYAFGIDITARKRAEAATVAARDEAERANRAKSQFLSQMSHELRTPLNAILGLGQLLASDPRHPLAAAQKSYVEEMVRGARHLLELINDVLDLGRVESGQLGLELDAVALEPLVAECLALVRPLAQAREVQLIAQPMPGLVVRADRRRLKQVLLNLLANAIKYNRRPGSVRVECRTEGTHLQLGVRDTGRGLTADERARLFQPFERLDAARLGVEGSGIGLALSRRLVDAMGGTLDVESEAGVGSLFWVRLPAASGGPAAAEAARAVAPPPPAVDGAPLVLYVEDNPVNVFVMEAMFERLPGYRLVCAQTPAEGLQLARAERPVLILLDVQLPEMNGPEVLQRLRAREDTRDIPVVAVSANAMADDIAEMMNAGAAAYLTKPLELDQLTGAVRRYARDGTAA